MALLKEEWSPEQIVGRLRLNHGDDPAMRVSHETIYRSVYITRWKVVPRELCKRLRTGRPIRKNNRHTVKGQWRSRITDARPIDERPLAAEDRSELGHLEGDLVIGSNNGQVATLVDRKSRFLTVVKLASRHTNVVVPALAEAYTRMDPRPHGTLTWDRGTKENTNKLLRQYLPKGTSLSTFSQDDLDIIAAKLNNRPRKCLGFRTPAGASVRV